MEPPTVLRKVPVRPCVSRTQTGAGALEFVIGQIAVGRLLLGARMRSQRAHAGQLGRALAQNPLAFESE
ncbi:hypothetical protein N5079_26300 [Planotetraspora sp. A-T 1434]|uniref:hypothetical protein n=1 Tax=Planotetraspora sp. A-T 1434 TaxID=2979219 RepID=UPI0021C0E487|nr:hypothetical protein [Planotetraspora sp. A-T 1434]MCT9933730.1 hypothetical protein [Planotetraspora sp. A-T 1434]